MGTITAQQIRAARMLLRWKQSDLADASGVSRPTITRLEEQPGVLRAQARTVRDLRETFLRHGVKFINDNDTIGVSKIKVETSA